MITKIIHSTKSIAKLDNIVNYISKLSLDKKQEIINNSAISYKKKVINNFKNSSHQIRIFNILNWGIIYFEFYMA
jgi:hypothetical protein